MSLRAGRRPARSLYRPSNPSLSDDITTHTHCKPVRVPDVLGNFGQFTELFQLWAACIEELKPLSRVMARGQEAVTSAA